MTIIDHTTGTTGSMTASAANGFGTVVFNPNATNCTGRPVDFHPEFSTSSPMTRNSGAAHTYNIAFSDEIGHFEHCGKVGTDPPTCLQAAARRGHQRRRHRGPDPPATTSSACPRRPR